MPGIGNHLFKRLIAHFDSPERVFAASTADIGQVEGMSRRLANAIRGYRTPASVKKDLDLTRRKGFKIVTQKDAHFPSLLREIPDPPPFLYVNGRLDDGIRNIAVVGSRNATDYGLTTAKRLSAHLAGLWT